MQLETRELACPAAEVGAAASVVDELVKAVS